MTEGSRGRVTITLGRSGQVVKRAGAVSDTSYADSVPAIGNKRSIRDRLGSNADSTLLHGENLGSKRHRGDISMSSRGSNGVDDMRIGKGDLRLKLMQKNSSRRTLSDDERDAVDLREQLSKTVRTPAAALDSRQRMHERKDNSFLGRIPPSRSTNHLPRSEPLRSSYPSFGLESLRRRSPERYVASYRGLSPRRSPEDVHRRLPMRTSDEVRSIAYMRKDALPSRPMSSSVPYVTNSTRPSTSVRPAATVLGQSRPPSNVVQKSSYLGDEHQTVDGLLQSLGLAKYAIQLKAEEVDMAALKQMGEHDLKELGIPMGPRKKILLALAPPRSKRQM
ncbi:uncharacterized protein LOC115756426 isoform X1 [Rhodamnia argentea]|uniref:Uncharacterized protein LOC115756426 isoform X1 n=2 Tax=Rhodamnia argentea TaxID=178133 RepID=A0ABM3HJQ5_9MYRT|nr:uncharacterized protein LOC115756426 isoform X1 [Rhodamnia argentea]